MKHLITFEKFNPNKLSYYHPKTVKGLNDNFWKWFGNSKVVDKEGNPLVMYHGSKIPVKSLTIFNSESGRYFFASTAEEASRCTKEYDNDVNYLGSYFIKAEKIFDNSHMTEMESKSIDSYIDANTELIIKELYSLFPEDNWIIEEYIDEMDGYKGYDFSNKSDLLKSMIRYWGDDFRILELDIIQKWIKSNGYDSFTTNESGDGLNLAVFNPNQIKSIENNGSYSLTSNNVFE